MNAITKIKLIREFMSKIDTEVQVYYDEYFCVDIDEKIVYIAYWENECERKVWNDFLHNEFNVNYNSYILSILHEVGHIMTYTEELSAEKDIMYFLLQLNYDEEKFEDYNLKYFRIPMEYNATKWAVDFYRNNYELCTELSTKLGLTD